VRTKGLPIWQFLDLCSGFGFGVGRLEETRDDCVTRLISIESEANTLVHVESYHARLDDGTVFLFDSITRKLAFSVKLCFTTKTQNSCQRLMLVD
jgi:hypothetical protein